MVDAEWLTVKDVAELFRVSEETVRRWIRAGEFPVLPLGKDRRGGYRLRRDHVQAFIDRNYRIMPKPTPPTEEP